MTSIYRKKTEPRITKVIRLKKNTNYEQFSTKFGGLNNFCCVVSCYGLTGLYGH